MFLCLVLHYSYVVNLLLKCTWNWDLFVTWLTTLTRGLALLAFTSNWSSRNMTCYSLATIWKNGKNNLFRGHSCIHTFKLFHNAVSQFSYDISAALKVCLTSERKGGGGRSVREERERDTHRKPFWPSHSQLVWRGFPFVYLKHSSASTHFACLWTGVSCSVSVRVGGISIQTYIWSSLQQV